MGGDYHAGVRHAKKDMAARTRRTTFLQLVHHFGWSAWRRKDQSHSLWYKAPFKFAGPCLVSGCDHTGKVFGTSRWFDAYGDLSRWLALFPNSIRLLSGRVVHLHKGERPGLYDYPHFLVRLPESMAVPDSLARDYPDRELTPQLVWRYYTEIYSAELGGGRHRDGFHSPAQYDLFGGVEAD